MSSAAQKQLYLATAAKWAQFEADVVYWKSQAAAYCILNIGMVYDITSDDIIICAISIIEPHFV
jgi:hypothetical protein